MREWHTIARASLKLTTLAAIFFERDESEEAVHVVGYADDGEVLVSLTETPSFSSSVSPSSQEENVQRVWNLTINAKSDQSPLVPLFKQPEVQRIECAADRGFLTLHFPAPHDTGSAFSGICLGGPKAGRDCAVSSECSGGVRTGDGAKCGLKLTEDVQLKHDATAAEVRAALEGFSLVDRVHVNFSDTTADSLCTAGGNGATVAFLRTRLDFATGGDLPMLSASAGASLRRKSVPVADGHGAMFLSPVREVVKGADSCAIEEVQSVSCRARGGDIVVSLLASSAKVPFNATAAQTKMHAFDHPHHRQEQRRHRGPFALVRCEAPLFFPAASNASIIAVPTAPSREYESTSFITGPLKRPQTIIMLQPPQRMSRSATFSLPEREASTSPRVEQSILAGGDIHHGAFENMGLPARPVAPPAGAHKTSRHPSPNPGRPSRCWSPSYPTGR